jgi:23S rRNA pseudouridine1911/1915/1917 synthase
VLEVLFEDNHLIAVNKPSGVLVQSDKTGDTPLSELIKSYLVDKYNKPGEAYLGVIHRIDRPTKGIVLFAKTSKALTRMNKAFADRTPTKKYWAIVSGELKSDSFRLEHWLLRKPVNNKSYAHDKEVNGSKKSHINSRKTCKLISLSPSRN